MAAQQGFQYEKNAAELLKGYNLVPKDFIPAGAGHDQPDLMLLYKNKQVGCELKISAASAGSLVIKYDIRNKKQPWMFGDIKPTEDEKLFIKGVAEEVDIYSLLKSKWKNLPAKFNPDLDLSNREKYEIDKIMFPDVKGEIPASKIEDYYASKKTYYVNVGTHGFYLMGSKNPYRLKGVPRFGSAASATYRARVQYKGGGNYQFTFEMQFSIPKGNKSPYNIAPINGKSVSIIEKDLNTSCFV